MGWGTMDSIFLGGMLSMSSTTIIYKAYDDLGLRRQKFTGEVLSVLILEDILGILLMVVLSALAVSRHFEGMALAGSLLKLAFFLILWFIVGVYAVPTLLPTLIMKNITRQAATTGFDPMATIFLKLNSRPRVNMRKMTPMSAQVCMLPVSSTVGVRARCGPARKPATM